MSSAWVDSMPSAYERWLVPALFQPFAVDLARRVAALHPRRVLELAAGSGALTRELLAALPDGTEVMATDLNDAMVDLGRAQAPGATWRQADAMALPFDAGQFDVVACQFGAMFFPDKPAAFAESRRVLDADGSFVQNVWGPLERHAFEASLVRALGAVFPEDPPTFMQTGPHGYADLALVTADLHEGGFDDVVSEALTLEGHGESAAGLAEGYCLGSPLRFEIERRAALDVTLTRVAEAMTNDLGDGDVAGSMVAHVLVARGVRTGDRPS
ncbi:MAG TPA: class I SAM-dependent methyltransferase [Acidimicrobiales bacterium]|nr:class I SAM-dependent methyltransferase [Acidimicrobiales bacterium]